MHFHSIDIFCHVVDNFGDIGFVYRFAREFKAAVPDCRIRVFIDDLNTLHAVNPAADPAKSVQEVDAIEYVETGALTEAFVQKLDIADILVEAFACHIPEVVLSAAAARSRVIINLEHLSAEAWVEGYHGKPSLLGSETLTKYFYMQGFTAATGGVIIDHRLLRMKPRLARHRMAFVRALLKRAGCPLDGLNESLVGTIFTYERGFDTMIIDLNGLPQRSVLLVFGEKSRKGMMSTLGRMGGHQIRENFHECGNIRVVFMPFITQPRYDALLCCADFNIVRGEDSIVRAILAGAPFIWNAYLQHDKYHKVKVEALLARMEEYFEGDAETFSRYRDLQLSFNDAEAESPGQTTGERYHDFFTNLVKITHATKGMSYFLARNCDLIRKFSDFLGSL